MGQDSHFKFSDQVAFRGTGDFMVLMPRADRLYDKLQERTLKNEKGGWSYFRERVADKRPTRQEESVVYLRLLMPDGQGREIYEMFQKADLVVSRKRAVF